jgi:fucose permease
MAGMPTRRARRTLTALAFLAFISLGLPDGVLGVAWPSIRATFNLPISHLGLLLATSVTGYVVSSFVSGEVVRRIGVGRLLLVSSALVTASLAGYALAPAWWVMLASGLLAGLGAGAIDAGINAWAAAEFPPRWVTWLHACYGVGATLGPLTMTTVLAAHLPWRWGYAAIGTVLAAMTVLFLLTLGQWKTSYSSESGRPQIESAGVLETLRRPRVWVSIAIFGLYTGIEVTAGTWAYSLFTEARNVPAPAAGVAVSTYWASLTAGRVLFGAAAGRLSRTVILRFGTCLAPPAAALVWLNVAPIASFAGLALLGFALAPIFPMLISATADRVGPAYAHQAVGFQVSAANLGAAAVPGLAGVLARLRTLEVIGPYLLATTLLLLVLHEMVLRPSRTAPTLAAATVEG